MTNHSQVTMLPAFSQVERPDNTTVEINHGVQTNNLVLELSQISLFRIHKYPKYQLHTLLKAYKRPSALIRSSTSFIISGIVLSDIPLSIPF